ncbi:MAG: hypothetical protein M1820_010218 [Bogoriella megaspora]|nr:MAG: hypothetical protein M1820_010218 [Bogoriella megaspora]
MAASNDEYSLLLPHLRDAVEVEFDGERFVFVLTDVGKQALAACKPLSADMLPQIFSRVTGKIRIDRPAKAPAEAQPSHLMNLPMELRFKILDPLLRKDSCIELPRSFQNSSAHDIQIKTGMSSGQKDRGCGWSLVPRKAKKIEQQACFSLFQYEEEAFNIEAQVLRVCKQISVEGAEVLYGRHQFLFHRGVENEAWIILESFLHTIGCYNRSLIRSITISAPIYPLNPKEILLWARAYDVSAPFLGLKPMHLPARNRLIGAVENSITWLLSTDNLRALTTFLTPGAKEQFVDDDHALAYTSSTVRRDFWKGCLKLNSVLTMLQNTKETNTRLVKVKRTPYSYSLRDFMAGVPGVVEYVGRKWFDDMSALSDFQLRGHGLMMMCGEEKK